MTQQSDATWEEEAWQRQPSAAHRPYDLAFALLDCPQITTCYRAYRDHWSIRDRKLGTFYYDCEYIRLGKGKDCPIAQSIAQGETPKLYDRDSLWERKRKGLLKRETVGDSLP